MLSSYPQQHKQYYLLESKTVFQMFVVREYWHFTLAEKLAVRLVLTLYKITNGVNIFDSAEMSTSKTMINPTKFWQFL